MSALSPKRTHLFFLDFWESSSESELSHVLHSLELELDDPELELSELNPVGWFRSTLSAKAVTSERSFYRTQNKHAMLGSNSFSIQICVMIRWLNWPTVKFQVSSIQKDIKMMLLGEKWQKRTFLTFSTLYHFLDSLGLPLTVLCHTIGKFTTLQKFWVTAMVLSKFRTTCHQPPGTNTVSPGPWRISSC